MELEAPDIAEIGQAFEVKCPLGDSGNPPAPIVFKVVMAYVVVVVVVVVFFFS